MNKRPISVIVVACLYILTGAMGLVLHITEVNLQHPFQNEVVWASCVRLVAIVCGVYLLRGSNWARWLALAWIAFHVVLSAFNTRSELAAHSLICVAIAYVLFRPAVSQYFGAAKTQAV